MPKTVTRRTLLKLFCLATVPIQSGAKEVKPAYPNRLLEQTLVPIDSQFIAVEGWVISVSNLAHRVK